MTSSTSEIPETLSRAFTAAREREVDLSKWIVRLIALRPVLNQFRGDTSLASIGNYNISILSLWSVSFLVVGLLRLSTIERAPAPIRNAILGFLFVVFAFGVPRILFPETLFSHVLLYCQFFIAALTARAVMEDVGMDYIVNRVASATLVLLAMHVTASLWAPTREAASDSAERALSISGYLGAFESKHAAGETFLAVTPFLVCGAMRNRKTLAAALIAPVLIFLVLAGQRVSMVAVTILVLSMLVLSRRLRLLVPIVAIGTVVAISIPTGRLQTFVEEKIEAEIEAYRSGDIEEVGAGRIGIVLLAESWYVDEFSPFEQLFGRGTSQAYEIHYIVGGVYSYAHLEVIELMIDYGLIGTGLAFLALILISRAKVRALRTDRSPTQLVGAAMSVVAISMMFFAMPLESGGTAALIAFWLFVPAPDRNP